MWLILSRLVLPLPNPYVLNCSTADPKNETTSGSDGYEMLKTQTKTGFPTPWRQAFGIQIQIVQMKQNRISHTCHTVR